MTPRFNTARLTKMLILELRSEVLGEAAIDFDGGSGSAAVAAISAFPPGPRRAFEVALWAKRMSAGNGKFAYVIRPDVTEAEIAALSDLDLALRERFGWGRLADRRAS